MLLFVSRHQVSKSSSLNLSEGLSVRSAQWRDSLFVCVAHHVRQSPKESSSNNSKREARVAHLVDFDARDDVLGCEQISKADAVVGRLVERLLKHDDP